MQLLFAHFAKVSLARMELERRPASGSLQDAPKTTMYVDHEGIDN